MVKAEEGYLLIKSLEDVEKAYEEDWIPTGSLVLNYAFVGWPVGRISHLWGRKGSGKTTLALLACSEALCKFSERKVLWIDAEKGLSLDRIESLHFDLRKYMDVEKRFEILIPKYAEQVYNGILEMADKSYSLVVIDSLGGMGARGDVEDEVKKDRMSTMPRLTTQFLKAVSGQLFLNRTSLLIVNQVREKPMTMGDPEYYSGGNALEHALWLDIKLRRGGAEDTFYDKNRREIGHKMIARVLKDKSKAPKGRREDFEVYYYHDRGIDDRESLASIGMALGLVSRGGPIYKYMSLAGEETKGKGLINFLERLKDNNVYDELYRRIVEGGSAPPADIILNDDIEISDSYCD